MAGRGRSAPEQGGVNSYLFKLIRESIPLTQEQLPPRAIPVLVPTTSPKPRGRPSEPSS